MTGIGVSSGHPEPFGKLGTGSVLLFNQLILSFRCGVRPAGAFLASAGALCPSRTRLHARLLCALAPLWPMLVSREHALLHND